MLSFRQYRYEQKLARALWKVDSKDIKGVEDAAAVAGLGLAAMAGMGVATGLHRGEAHAKVG